MILFQDSRFLQTIEMPVQTGYTVDAEGQALAADYTGGVFGVRKSSTTASDKFVGVSFSQQLTLLYLPYFESLTVSAGLTVQTAFATSGVALQSGSLRVYNTTHAGALTAGGAAGNYVVNSAGLITVVAGGSTVAGDVLLVSYRYSPTTVQAKSLAGDIPAGGAASLTLGTVGVITQGTVVTSEFDTAVDWTGNPTSVVMGANGLFTVGGTGAAIPNCYITQVPSVASPFLGIHFSA
jgi:hypothetical protein